MSQHRAPVRVRSYRCEHTAVFDDGQGAARRVPGAVATVRGSEDAVEWAIERVRKIATQLMATQAQVDAYVRDVRQAHPVQPEHVLTEGGRLDLEVRDTDGSLHEITVHLHLDVPAPVRLPRHQAAV
ncbi:hypothetical protein AQI95_41805 [Streptomyces yokosukanensis]|uniref:Uncharacterized protein n=1 Tax=Streptomyces yokosukanensis TaxID=67386 RepID=A0A124HDE8_9ACTN|nr:hypothetical protein [Streptomyces yokosukanensis]KUM97358.1 hypothetical protein AQI95_41805 [Streptomyces yokosukanensis]